LSPKIVPRTPTSTWLARSASGTIAGTTAGTLAGALAGAFACGVSAGGVDSLAV
jgi:hypothetical protein